MDAESERVKQLEKDALENARAQWRSWAVASGTSKTWKELVEASELAVPDKRGIK